MIFATLANELAFRVNHHAFEVGGLDHVEVLQLAAMKGTFVIQHSSDLA